MFKWPVCQRQLNVLILKFLSNILLENLLLCVFTVGWTQRQLSEMIYRKLKFIWKALGSWCCCGCPRFPNSQIPKIPEFCFNSKFSCSPFQLCSCLYTVVKKWLLDFYISKVFYSKYQLIFICRVVFIYIESSWFRYDTEKKLRCLHFLPNKQPIKIR